MKIDNLNRDNVRINEADNRVAFCAADSFKSRFCAFEGIIIKFKYSVFTFGTYRHLGRSFGCSLLRKHTLGAPTNMSRSIEALVPMALWDRDPLRRIRLFTITELKALLQNGLCWLYPAQWSRAFSFVPTHIAPLSRGRRDRSPALIMSGERS